MFFIYTVYIYYIAKTNNPGVDYSTFMAIGNRLLSEQQVYTGDSYYPLTTVLIFAFFAWLPSTLSIILWHSTPILAAIVITRKPYVVFFAPLLDHLIAGNTTLIPMLGLWLYAAYRDDKRGGIGLAIMMLKPHLAIVPLAYAASRWLRLRSQAVWFAIASGVLFVPTLLIDPSWVWKWLHNPRELKTQAFSGIVPRLAILVTDGFWFWAIVIVCGAGLLWLLWRLDKWTLETAVLWSFVVLPFMHNYDLIQLIPILGTQLPLAVALSMPEWIVILAFFQTWQAWIVVCVIPMVLLWVLIRQLVDASNTPP